jgi:hypothetical protein
LVIAVDADRVKPLIKTTVRTLRTPALAKAAKLDQISNVPLKRIIDTVHFAAKEDAPALQLADLCAFMIGRVMKDKSVPDPAFSIVWNNLKWIEEYKGIKFPDLADLIEPTQAS